MSGNKAAVPVPVEQALAHDLDSLRTTNDISTEESDYITNGGKD